MRLLEQTSLPEVLYVDSSTMERETILLIILHTCSIINIFLCIFGIFTNVWNIIVFAWQGFADTINISFIAMSVSNLLSVAFLMFMSLVTSPFFSGLDIPWEWSDVLFLAAGGPRDSCIRITGIITAFLTFERCLCVAMPLTVKQIISRKVTLTVISVIYFLMALKLLPHYTNAYLGWTFNNLKNETLIGKIFRNNNREVERLPFVLSVTTQIVAFCAVIVFTAVLVFCIGQSSKWRTSVASKEDRNNRNNSARNTRTVNMVLTVAVIYIICYTPYIVTFSCSYFVPGLYDGGQMKSVFSVMWAVNYLFDVINAGTSIFIYYQMSSRYRSTCRVIIKLIKG